MTSPALRVGFDGREQPMEMAAIIAGVATVLVAFLPGISSQERAACLFIGASVAGYAVYVLNQRSGTFYFPAALFALSIAMIARAVQRWLAGQETHRPHAASMANST